MRMFFVCAIAMLGACTPGYVRTTPPVRPEPAREIEISGELEVGAATAIERALSLLGTQMRDSLRVIRVIDDQSHIGRRGFSAIGHLCPENDRRICLMKGKVSIRIVWHECAHVYTFHLSDYYTDYDSLRFVELWEKIAGDVYTEVFNEARAEGLLTSYSRRNAYEDIAEWYRECMHYLYLDTNWQVFEDNKYLKTDLRYRKKLALMHKYGFFSDHEYERLKPLFQ